MEKSKVIEKLFLYIVTYSYLLLPLCFLLYSNKKKDFIPLVIAIYGILCFLFIFFYDDISKDTRKYLKTAYTFFEYSVFATIFWVNIKRKGKKRLMILLSVLFLSFQIIYLLTGNVKRLDTAPIGIETILLLLYIIYFFYQFSKNLGTSYIYNHYAFWIAVGILVYLGGSFFFFILIEHLAPDDITTFGNMTYVAEIIKNILFATSIYIYSKYPFKSMPEKKEFVPFLDHI